MRRRQGGFGTLRLLLGRKRLSVSAVERHTGAATTPLRVAQVRVGGMRGDKGLRL